MRQSLFILFLALGLAAGAQTTIHDENAQERNLSGFHAVSVSGSIDLYLTQGNEEKVMVSAADKKWLPYIRTEVKNGTLKIYWKKGENDRVSVEMNTEKKKLRAYVSVKSLDLLSNSGSGDVRIQGTLNSPKLDIRSSGSGDVSGAIQVSSLSIHGSGSGDYKFKGAAAAVELQLSGSGDVENFDLAADSYKIAISGSGGVRAQAEKNVSVAISGSGDVVVRGNASVENMRISGSGDFKRIK